MNTMKPVQKHDGQRFAVRQCWTGFMSCPSAEGAGNDTLRFSIRLRFVPIFFLLHPNIVHTNTVPLLYTAPYHLLHNLQLYLHQLRRSGQPIYQHPIGIDYGFISHISTGINLFSLRIEHHQPIQIIWCFLKLRNHITILTG